jgi:hypothetical protein
MIDVEVLRPLRLAFLGMVDQNGHPFSWGAIINGKYDDALIQKAGFPVISEYLSAQPSSMLGLPGVQITHIWCDDLADAESVAASAQIPHVVAQPTDVLGHVDAVVIPTDKGEEHLERARPFVAAGLPVFIDKPLTIREDHLSEFARWHDEGKAIYSSSAMRYATEFRDLRERLDEVGELRLILVTCAKSWERYGIHALESVYSLLPAGGWRDVSNTGGPNANIVHVRHEHPVDVVLAVNYDMFGGFCHVTVYGTKGHLNAKFKDTFAAFKTQLVTFVDALRGDTSAFDFGQTVEQMGIIIAGIQSREQHGRRVAIDDVIGRIRGA